MKASFLDVPGIYQIQNTKTSECYIGSSIHVFKRLKDHIKHLSTGSHINKLLEKSWKHYGPEVFHFSCVEVVSDASEIPDRELYWIKKTGALNVGFNRKTDQFKHRTLIQVGSTLHGELEQLGLGSMNQTLAHLLRLYEEKKRRE